ncbi:MAG TPA: hypothetical protein VLS48_02905, partial [Anaerolineales bacterium]|nr:hypothetical protein [Anaerolineales bacterium]
MKKTITRASVLMLAVLLISACSSPAALLTGLAANVFTDAAPAGAQPKAAALQTTPESQAPASDSVAPVEPGLLAAYENALERVYNEVSPSVVNI